MFLQKFETWFLNLRTLFPSTMDKQSLQDIIYKQGLLLHGDERKFNRFLPKVLNLIIQRIDQLMTENSNLNCEEAVDIVINSKHTEVNEISIFRT